MLSSVSNISKVKANFARYKGSADATIRPSTKKGKKFDVIYQGKVISFGDINYADFTKTQDESKRRSYLARSGGIKDSGKWSANSLARALLWQ
jgi:hypothetical protein